VKRIALPFLLSLTLAQPQIYAQQRNFKFDHLTIDDGLSQDIVTAIAQDGEGFIWFGTEDGLNLYDGYSFTILKHNPRDSTTIAGNSISSLMADGQARLWVATIAGLDVVDVRTREVTHICLPGSRNPIHANTFCLASDSSVWIGSENGLFRWVDGQLTRPLLGGRRYDHPVMYLSYDSQDCLWVCDTVGVHYFRVSHDVLSPLGVPPSFGPLQNQRINSIFRDRRHSLWVCTAREGIFRYDSTLEHSRQYSLKPHTPVSLVDGRVLTGVEDRSGTIWFATLSGLEVFDPRLEGFAHMREGLMTAPGFLGTRVYSLFVDRSGIVWIGTYRGGVNSYASTREKFRVYIPPQEMDVREVYALAETGYGTILAGTDKGLLSIRTQESGESWVRRPELDKDPVFSICLRRNGEIWGGADGEIVRLADRSTGTTRIKLPVHDNARLIYEDSDRDLWIGTELYGLYTLRNGDREVGAWPRGKVPFSGGAWSMFQDRRSNLWIGTWESDLFFEVEKARDSIISYGSGPGADVQFPNPVVRAVRQDTLGALWFGTWGGGLYRLDPSSRAFQQYTESDGLASNFVKSLEIDRSGRLWIGTERGLSRFDPLERKFTTYTVRDGLPSNFFYSGASSQGREGVLYFGARGGFIAVHPDSIPQNRFIPPVVITRFRVFDKAVSLGISSSNHGPVSLRHDEDFFSFEFVALDFTRPEMNRYSYMLEGFDRGWIDAGNRRYAAYTHLDPGTYQFRVRGSNNDGVWNETGASLTLIIEPAFWMTWPFRLALVLLLLVAIFLAYRYRVHAILQVEQLRRHMARDLHDDIGTNLSAIVLASQMGARFDTSAQVRGYLDDIKSTALVTQDQMRDIVWMLNPRNDPPQMLVARMKDDAARLLRDIPYTFIGPSSGLPSSMDLETKRQLFLIYKEALHNIARHSAARSTEIALEFKDGFLELRMSDDGKGFDAATTMWGNGLENMKARARQMQADLRIDSRPGGGTRIFLRAKIP
jgi:ligand-binding sensor domain-containing protein/signal transduction histidine kinase